MINCINLLPNGACRIVSTLVNDDFTPQQRMCNSCSKAEFPCTLNTVTCSVARLSNDSVTPILVSLHSTEFNKPGTCLKNLLKRIKIVSDNSCNCEEYASQMNYWGTSGCEERMDEIIKYLQSRATIPAYLKGFFWGGYTSTVGLVEEAITRSHIRNPITKLQELAKQFGVENVL